MSSSRAHQASTRRAVALASPDAQAQPWYRVGPVLAVAAPVAKPGAEPVAKPSTRADVYVFDTIGGWMGMTADDFVRDVGALAVDEIVLHLNTPGGDVFEAVAMANVLRAHPAKVNVVVDGLAASAGSVLAMAGDEIVMGVGSSMMVHDAWGMCVGNAADMAKTAEMLASTSDSIASTYAARAGGTTTDWRAVMVAETWYTADEAVAAGLANRVAGTADQSTATGEQIVPGGTSMAAWDLWDTYKAQDRFDLSAFNYAGRDHAPAPTHSPTGSAGGPAAAGSTDTTEESMTDTLSDGLRQKLGLAADADEATILSALDESLAERADSSIPDGQVLIPAAALADLQASAATTKALAEKQHARERTEVLNSLRDRFAPASRAAWEKQYDVDPEGTKSYLESAPVIVPINALGADTAPVGTVDDELFAQLFGATPKEV